MADKIAGMKVVINEEQRAQIGEAIESILKKGWLMEGPWQTELQEMFQKRTGRAHAITYNSETSALSAIFEYLWEQMQHYAGREPLTVGVQGNSFPSVGMAARRAGFELEFLDIDDDMAVDSDDLTDSIQLLDALVVQWNGGYVSDRVHEILDICTKADIPIIEDCAHAAGSYGPDGMAAGAYGDFAVYSLAATKPLQTGQGGILLTDDPEFAQFAFQYKNYGRTDWFQKGEYTQEGGNYHMTELQAAVGVILHPLMDEAIEWRNNLLAVMTAGRYVHYLPAATNGSPNLYKVPLEVPRGSQAKLRESAAEKAIELGSEIYPFVTSDLECWDGWYDGIDLPNTRRIAESHICLPMHNGLQLYDAERINDWLDSVEHLMILEDATV